MQLNVTDSHIEIRINNQIYLNLFMTVFYFVHCRWYRETRFSTRLQKLKEINSLDVLLIFSDLLID